MDTFYKGESIVIQCNSIIFMYNDLEMLQDIVGYRGSTFSYFDPFLYRYSNINVLNLPYIYFISI